MKPRKRPLSVLTLRIDLKNVKPLVWRRIEIPSTSSFHNLHNFIQACMPWSDCHLHNFEKYDHSNGMRCLWVVEDRRFAEEDGFEYVDEGSTDERTTQITDHLKSVGDSCTYLYDFGDGWEHRITVEKISPPHPYVDYPLCTKAKGICPFEDSGGPWGWAEKVQILKNPKHPKYVDLCDWIGLDPEDSFDLSEYEVTPESVTEMMRDIV